MKGTATHKYSVDLHIMFNQGRYEEISDYLSKQRDNFLRHAVGVSKEHVSPAITRKRTAQSTIQENKSGETLLHRFIKLDQPIAMRYFAKTLQLGEANDINKRTRQGIRPIHYAVEFGNVRRIETLIEMGADIEGIKDGIEGLIRFARTKNVKEEVITYLDSQEFRAIVEKYKEKAKEIVSHANKIIGAKLHQTGQSSITQYFGKQPAVPAPEVKDGLASQNSTGSIVDLMNRTELEGGVGSSSAFDLRSAYGPSGFNLRSYGVSSSSSEAAKMDKWLQRGPSDGAKENVSGSSSRSKVAPEIIDLTFDDIALPSRKVQSPVPRIDIAFSVGSEGTSRERSDSESSRGSFSLSARLPKVFRTAREILIDQVGDSLLRTGFRPNKNGDRLSGAKSRRSDSEGSTEVDTSSDSGASSMGSEIITGQRERDVTPLRETKRADHKSTPKKSPKADGGENEEPNSPSKAQSRAKYDEDNSLANRAGWIGRVSASGSISERARY